MDDQNQNSLQTPPIYPQGQVPVVPPQVIGTPIVSNEIPPPTNSAPFVQPKKSHKKLLSIVLIALIVAVAVMVLIVLLGNSTASQVNKWRAQNHTAFDNYDTAIRNDSNNIVNDISNYNVVSLQTDCNTLKSDVQSMLALPPYPVATTQASFHNALEELSKSGTDCETAITQQNTSLINQSLQEQLTGLRQFNSLEATIRQD